MYNSRL